MIKDEAADQDLHFTSGDEVNGGDIVTGFDPMVEDDSHRNHHQTGVEISDKDLWLADDRDNQENLLDEASIFYNDFPPLPDFPCMSSSSSSSSKPATSKPIAAATSSSSSAAGGDVKPERHAALSSTASMEIPPPSDLDCIDVMENFGYMDLIDANDIWDPSSIFQSENENPQEFVDDQLTGSQPEHGTTSYNCQEEEEEGDAFSFLQGNSELAMIFFEWLKQNKDYISAEDMRSIKLKRSTIESASKRLGSTKEGKKQLLKLILEWVEQYQLQKKRLREEGGGPQSPYETANDHHNLQHHHHHLSNQNPNPNPSFNYTAPLPLDQHPNTACFSASLWINPGYPPPAMAGYNADPYNPNPISLVPMNHHHHSQVVNGIPYPNSAEFSTMEHAQSWPVSPYPIPQQSQFNPFPDSSNMMSAATHHQPAMYGNPYQMFDPISGGERLMRLGSSATKEARKKRMARQRRLYSHHHHQNRHSGGSNQNQNNQLSDITHAVAGDGGDDGGSPGNWMYWSSSGCGGGGGGGGSSEMVADGGGGGGGGTSQSNAGDPNPVQPQSNYQKQACSDRRQQGWKSEKNLKFLLQKVLKQSDVGNLGRIVLPKKEAESHLPELETRDGISIAMEDIGTSRVWNMRYRFWPNNKSRMYLLENTGDFVRVNGLQEGDFIVIYSDTKCGKYMIRGVKVRQPGGKLEVGKKPMRRNIRSLSLVGNGSKLAPIKQAVR